MLSREFSKSLVAIARQNAQSKWSKAAAHPVAVCCGLLAYHSFDAPIGDEPDKSHRHVHRDRNPGIHARTQNPQSINCQRRFALMITSNRDCDWRISAVT